jgi:serine/threonine protein kinase
MNAGQNISLRPSLTEPDDANDGESGSVAEGPNDGSSDHVLSAERAVASVKPSSSRDLKLAEGMLVADRYRLVDKCGQGTMGEVWRAQHTSLSHMVAIKFLKVGQLGESNFDDNGTARFELEAKVSAELGTRSPHIVRVTDHGKHGSFPFIVMEFMVGESLASRLANGQRLTIAQSISISLQLLKALDAAHRIGVVHRDIKPANVFLCNSDSTSDELHIKLLDFGIAKIVQGDGLAAEGTADGILLGTPNYMSPEQIGGPSIDRRSDIWAVGVLLYRMITGVAPFAAQGFAELAMQIISKPIEPPSKLVPEASKLDKIVETALMKRPDDRFSSARDFADALKRCSEDTFRSINFSDSFEANLPALASPSPDVLTLERHEATTHQSRGRTRVIAAVACFILFAGIIGITFVRRNLPGNLPSSLPVDVVDHASHTAGIALTNTANAPPTNGANVEPVTVSQTGKGPLTASSAFGESPIAHGAPTGATTGSTVSPASGANRRRADVVRTPKDTTQPAATGSASDVSPVPSADAPSPSTQQNHDLWGRTNEP